MHFVADTFRQYPSTWMCISDFRSSSTLLKPPPLNIGYVQEESVRQAENLDEDLRRKLSLNCFNEEDSKTRRITSTTTTTTTNTTNARKSRLSVVSAEEIVLRRCGQTEILNFKECYPESILRNCQKIGEGVYGEVFLYRCFQPQQKILASPTGIHQPQEQQIHQQHPNGITSTSVMKIIPIEGDLIVNGEKQKRFDEILSEIVITMELSNLRNNKKNSTCCFTEVKKIRCTRGQYPDRLVELWDLYDETKGSENDSPQMFTSNQKYVVLELANGGQDLESFVFNNAMQAYAMFKQTACALAVAETELKFEHRDLHWGNVLINPVDNKSQPTIPFRLNGKEIQVETFGVQVAIIDFTLSRIEFEGVVIYNDLSLDDELFMAKGDYQFDIYRLMKEHNGNQWQKFEPFSNILWLHYILDKVQHLRYKNPRSKMHKEYLHKLNELKDEMLIYESVTKFVQDKFF